MRTHTKKHPHEKRMTTKFCCKFHYVTEKLILR